MHVKKNLLSENAGSLTVLKGRIYGLCLTPHLNSAIIPWTFFPFPVNNEHFDDKTDDNHTQNATIQSEYPGETAGL